MPTDATMPAVDAALTQLTTIISDLGAKLMQAGETHGPAAIDLVLKTYQFYGIATIGRGVLFGLIAYLCWRVSMWAWGRVARTTTDGFPEIPIGIVTTFGLIGSGVACADHIFDIWAWAAAFEPKIYLAHLLLESLTK